MKRFYPGMFFHQVLSFSPVFAKCDRAETVFWPGCALLGKDPAILAAALKTLRVGEPDIGLCTDCCAQPTKYLFGSAAYRRKKQWICRQLASNHVRRIYTACPNCLQSLREITDLEVLSVWPLLDRYYSPETPLGGVWALHDPCPCRSMPEVQDAARSLMRKAGAEVVEFAHCREQTHCCGNREMLHVRAPNSAEKIRKSRVRETPAPQVSSYCQGCLGAFAAEGLPTAHLLEILYGKSRRYGWLNRLRTCLWLSRH